MTTCLAADLFGVDPIKVARDIIRQRDLSTAKEG